MPALLRRLTLLCTAVALLAPASALASGSSVIKDCTDDGRLSKRYAQSDYSSALANLPTDVDEYTDCRDVIRNAQLGAAGGGNGTSGAGGAGGAGGTGGGTGTASGGLSGAGGAAGGDPGVAGPNNADEALAAATPAERKAVEQRRSAGARAVRVGDQVVEPGALGFGSVGAVNQLPASLAVVIVLLCLALGAGLGHLVRSRVLARRPTTG